MNEVKRNFSKWLYWFLLAVAIILVYKFLDNFTAIGEAIGRFLGIISPFLAGALLGYLLYIPSSRIENKILKSKNKFFKKKARPLSVFITFILTILIIIILFNVILPVVTQSVIELVNNFQNYWNIAIERLNNLPEDSILKDEKVVEIINSFGESIKNIDLKQYINPEKITEYIKSVIGVASGVFDVFVAIVVSIYLLLERNQILNFFRKVIVAIAGNRMTQKIERYIQSSNKIFYKFISGQLIDALVIGILVTIAMAILGVKYAVLLGFMIGLFNIIPYFGAIVAVVLSILITLITGGFSQAFIMAIVVIILQQIDSNIINPQILGDSLEISPLLVIFSVTIGGAYFGVLGMFLAVPVAAVLKIIVDDWIEFKNKKRKISDY